VTEFDGLPTLNEPVAIAAFEGWNDAADAATAAVEHLEQLWEAREVTTIDPEEFYDFQVNRPQITLVDGDTRRIEWPGTTILTASPDGAKHDVVLIRGTEPSMRWRGFCESVLEVCHSLGVKRLVLLGALLADVPHSRPVSVSAHATDPGLVERLSLQPPTYEGPTGIVGVLHQGFADAGLPAASLWAAVPHYVAVAPNPKGALALLRRLESLVGVTVDATDLEDAATDYEQQVSRAVELDPDVQAFVERLERAADEQSGRPDPGSLPSGDVLAREFQRFLRQRGEQP